MHRQGTRHLSLTVGLLVLAAGCTARGGSEYKAAKPPADAGRAPVWSVDAPVGAGRPVRAQVAGDVVVVQGENRVVALDKASGRKLWDAESGEGLDFVSVTGTAVVLTKDSPSRGVVRVLDLKSGAVRLERREIKHQGITRDFLTVIEETEDGRTRLAGYDLATGKERWSRSMLLMYSEALPRRDPDGTAPSLSGTGSRGMTDPLVAPAGERLLVWPGEAGRPREQSPVQVVDVRSGKTVAKWKGSGELCGRMGADYLQMNQALFDMCPEQEATAIDLGNGKRRWTAKGLAKVIGGGPMPVVHGRTLLAMTGDGRPRLVETGTGRERWTGQSGDWFLGMNDHTVVVWSGEGARDLAGLDAASGQRRWTKPIRSPLAGVHARMRDERYLMSRYAVVGERLVYSGHELLPSSQGTPRPGSRLGQVLNVVDTRTGRGVWTARYDTELLGAGNDWIVAGTRSSSSSGITGAAPQIQFYAP